MGLSTAPAYKPGLFFGTEPALSLPGWQAVQRFT